MRVLIALFIALAIGCGKKASEQPEAKQDDSSDQVKQAENAKAEPVVETEYSAHSEKFGDVTMVVRSDGSGLSIVKDGQTVRRYESQPSFNLGGREGILLSDVNNDEAEDLVAYNYDEIGMGEFAGRGYSTPFVYVSKDNVLVQTPDDFVRALGTGRYARMENDKDDLKSIAAFARHYYETGELPLVIGKKVSNSEREEYNLREGELLVFTFLMRDSKKRVTLSLSSNRETLFYRFGAKGKVELEYNERKGQNDQSFTFLFNEEARPVSFVLSGIRFKNAGIEYVVYDNTGSIHSEQDGVGVRVTTNPQKPPIFLQGDESSKKGNLGDLPYLDWIETKTYEPFAGIG